jgi:hypothetical protein
MTQSTTQPQTTYVRLLTKQPLDPVQRSFVGSCRNKWSPRDVSHALVALTATAHDHPDAFSKDRDHHPSPAQDTSNSSRRRRTPKGNLSLAISLPSPILNGGIKLTAPLIPPVSLSINTAPIERWLTQLLTGLSPDQPIDAKTLEKLPKARLQEAARASGLKEAWRAHVALERQSDLTVRTACPPRMSREARSALDTLECLESRFGDYPHLQAISDRLAANNPDSTNAITSRLQTIVGEPLSGDALLNRGHALRNPFTRTQSSNRFHQLHEEIEGILQDATQAVHFPREPLLERISALQAWLELDWQDLTRCAADFTEIIKPKRLAPLWRILNLNDGTQANSTRIMVAREVQQLVDETSRALDSYRTALTEVALSIRNCSEHDSLLSPLRTCQRSYSTHYGRLVARLLSAHRELDKPGPVYRVLAGLFSWTEIELLLSAVEKRAQLEAGMRVRAACASVRALPALSKRVLCQMIARQLGLPY